MALSSLTGQAILPLSLPTIVLAQELRDILDALVTLYNNRIWLEAATKDPVSPLLAYQGPAASEALVIERASIGSPNEIELKGKAKQIAQLAAVLASLLAPATVTMETYKSYAEAQKARVETEKERLEVQKTQLEIKKLQLDMDTETHKLENQHKIDHGSATERRNDDADAKRTLKRHASKITMHPVVTWPGVARQSG